MKLYTFGLKIHPLFFRVKNKLAGFYFTVVCDTDAGAVLNIDRVLYYEVFRMVLRVHYTACVLTHPRISQEFWAYKPSESTYMH